MKSDKNTQCYVPKDCPNGKANCGCDECFANHGYYTRREQRELIRKHDLHEGFFRELCHWLTGYLRKDGCILPRKYRSAKCNSFICKGRKNG